MPLPDGVQAVKKPSGKTYYYYAPGRSTKGAGARTGLGSDPSDPEFWRKLRAARGERGARPGTFDDLIEAYKASPEWGRLRPASQKGYAYYLEKLATMAGDRMVAAMTSVDLYQLRDGMAATPVSANHMLSVLKGLISWGIKRGYRPDNPVLVVERLEVEDDGARPWPDEGYAFVIANAPVDLMRMAFLGRATGQRAKDLARMRPADLVADGIIVRISKLRDKRHFVPLTATQMAEIRSWGVTDLDYFIKSPTGKAYHDTHLNSRWNRWRAKPEAAPIRALDMKIHGLRATAVADRRESGTEDGSIADELGLSVQMVQRYARFADKARSARASRDRRERAGNGFENRIATLKTDAV